MVAEAGFRRRPTTHDVPRVRRPGDTSAFCRTLVTQIGPQHLLRDGALAGQPGEKQGFLGRIVDIGAELFAISAACVRAEAQRTADPVEGEQAYELAEAFCQQATLRVEALFDALWSNTDSIDVRLANDVLEGRYTWLEQGILDQSEGTGPWIASWELVHPPRPIWLGGS